MTNTINNMEEETWKDVVGWEGIYKVSSHGNIFCCERVSRNGRLIKAMNKKEMLKNNGYLGTSFYDSNTDRFKNVLIHRIVAEAFIPNTENKPCIDHINANKIDNRVCNLRWCTHKENSNNPLSLKALSVNGKVAQNKPCTIIKKRNNAANVSVYQYTIEGVFIRKYISIHEADRFTSIGISGICNCCRRKINSAGGYIWRYEGDENITYHKGSTAKAIVQLDAIGEYIDTYKSAIEAYNKTGVSRSCICNCCKGKKEIAGGFRWRYKEDYHE